MPHPRHRVPPLAAPLAALSLLVSNPSLAAPNPNQILLRLVAINDFHGNLEEANLSLPWPRTGKGQPRFPATTPGGSTPGANTPGASTKLPTGGAAALAGLVQSLRQEAPHSLVISSGDLIGASPLISSLLHDEPTIAFSNRLGVDLASPGNHEFDRGLNAYLRLLNGGCAPADPHGQKDSCALGRHGPAWFQTIAANVDGSDGIPLFPATTVRTFGTVRVGFIGAVTKTTPSLVIPRAVQGLRFTDEVESINRAAAQLQRLDVQAIVAVIHEGGETGEPGQALDWNNSSCPKARGRIFDIARQLSPAIDVIFSAHTHQGYNCRIDGRPILQATAYGRGVSVVDLVLDPRSGDVDRERTSSRNLPVLNSRTEPAQRQAVLAGEPSPWRQLLERARPDARVAAEVAATARVVAPKAQRAVGWIGGGFARGGPVDFPAGRLIADAQLAATRAPASGGAEAALVNPGGIRADLPCRTTPPCPISYGEIVAMQPFSDTLVVLTLNGAELKDLLESQQPPEQSQPTLLIPSASLRYSWLSQAPFGQRVRDLRLNGRPVQPRQSVRLVVNTFLAQGGDGFTLFRQGRDPVGGPLDVKALEEFLQTRPMPDPLPRITLVRSPWSHRGTGQPSGRSPSPPRAGGHHLNLPADRGAPKRRSGALPIGNQRPSLPRTN
jgi:5'-nucleotidase